MISCVCLLSTIEWGDQLVSRYDSAFCRPPGAPLRSFLTECLAGPLVGGDPKLIHRFCDLYEHARHSYRLLTFTIWVNSGFLYICQLLELLGRLNFKISTTC